VKYTRISVKKEYAIIRGEKVILFHTDRGMWKRPTETLQIDYELDGK